jgi:hypothetical protein
MGNGFRQLIPAVNTTAAKAACAFADANYSGWQRVLDARRLTTPARRLHAAAQLG